MGSDHGGFALFVEFDFISIHAPRMGNDLHHLPAKVHVNISIHAPRMGSDRATRGEITNNHPFQSTLPGWGATSLPLDNLSQAQRISIHAPRMGSDWYTSR